MIQLMTQRERRKIARLLALGAIFTIPIIQEMGVGIGLPGGLIYVSIGISMGCVGGAVGIIYDKYENRKQSSLR
jgi:hypothetical protein